jgi:hypothetical protein
MTLRRPRGFTLVILLAPGSRRPFSFLKIPFIPRLGAIQRCDHARGAAVILSQPSFIQNLRWILG